MIEPRCSFCGKSKAEVQRLIEGADNAYICDECVLLGAEILSEEGLTGAAARATRSPRGCFQTSAETLPPAITV